MPTKNKAREDFAAWHGPVLLDTCAWIWLIDGHISMAKAPYLPSIEAAARDSRLLLAPISMWEVATKVANGRLTLSLPVNEWIHQGKRLARLIDAPMTAEIAVESAALPGAFHGDPADRLIVATARVLNAAIVTGDEKILAYALNGFIKAWRVNRV
jgi:PIN domain nuclease of toxin-antitoxin system